MNVSFVGAGKYSDVFALSHGKHRVIMKLSYYRDDTVCKFVEKVKRGDVAGAERAKQQDSIAVSSSFAKYTNALVHAGVSPHFVVVYCDVDCKYLAPRLKLLIKERVQSMSRVQLKYNHMCFMEVFSNNMTRYLTKHKVTPDTLRAVIFQLVYTLACVQKLFPGFRHNDLSTNNVLVKRLTTPASASYTFEGSTFYTTKVPVLVALSDYDFTHVPNHATLTNERILNGRYRVDGKKNVSYDTHFLFKSIWKCIMSRSEHAETVAFFKSLPLQTNDRQDTEIPQLEPRLLLQSAYFAPLRIQPPKTRGKVAAYSLNSDRVEAANANLATPSTAAVASVAATSNVSPGSTPA